MKVDFFEYFSEKFLNNYGDHDDHSSGGEPSAEPAAETIKHSPETEVKKANVSFKNPNRPISTLDRVLERISK